MADKQDINIKLKNIDVDEVLNKKVKKFSSGAYVGVPKRHLGKEVIVIVKKKKGDKE